MVHVICIVSRFCNVIEVKVAVASWMLFALAAVDWFTRHDLATACVAVAVNVRTTVEDFGDEPEMSVTVPKARAKPFVVSSVSVGLPQSPFVAPVTESVATGAVVPADMRSEEHTSELQSPCNLVCRLLLEKKTHLTYHLLS